jgi:site-specific recombinase XerD
MAGLAIERRRQDARAGRPPGRRVARGEYSIKDKRDRAILSTLLYHAPRRVELCKLKVRDFRQARRGVPHLKVSGKGDNTRYLPLHPGGPIPSSTITSMRPVMEGMRTERCSARSATTAPASSRTH